MQTEPITPQPTQAPAKSRGAAARLLRRLTLTALFIALGVAVKSVTKITLLPFGAGGMQISFGGIFTFFPAALFGPVYGGIASAMSDLLGHLIAPTGAYIPWLTLSAFAGGVVKGLLWRWLTTTGLRRARLPAAVLFLCLGLLGGATGLSLQHDGILPRGTWIAKQSQLPTRWQIEQSEELSPLSRFAVSLAKYNKDTFTLIALPTDTGEGALVVLPQAVIQPDGSTVTPTKLELSDLNAPLTLSIPAAYRTVKLSGRAVEEGTLTVLADPDSAAAAFAGEHGLPCRAPTDGERSAVPAADWSLRSSDTYRKYLSGYLNFACAGLILVALMGLGFLGLNLLAEHLRRKNFRGEQYLRIALCIIASGMLVTTVNTWILRLYLPAWSGREWLILWIPRVCEEWIVCLIQAYAISLLYRMLTVGRLKTVWARLQK